MIIIGSNDILCSYKSFELLEKHAPKLTKFITKSITKNERSGNISPHVYQKDSIVFVSSGLCNPGLANMLPEVGKYIERYSNRKIIVSLASDPDNIENSPTDEIFYMIDKFLHIGVTSFEINMRCPNVIHKLNTIQFTEKLLKTANLKYKKIQIIPKFTTSDYQELIAYIRICKKYNFCVVSFAPYMPAVVLHNKKFMLGNKEGVSCGMSNAYLTKFLLYKISKDIDVHTVKVIPSGGCLSGADTNLSAMISMYHETKFLGASYVCAVSPFWPFSAEKLELLNNICNHTTPDKR